jgi:hypothetical protein
MSTWTGGLNAQLVGQFYGTATTGSGPLEVGTFHTDGEGSDFIAVMHTNAPNAASQAIAAPRTGTSKASPLKVTNRQVTLYNQDGSQSITVNERLLKKVQDVGDGPTQTIIYYNGVKEHAIDYNPTWPIWSAKQYGNATTLNPGPQLPLKALTTNTITGVFPNDPNQNKWLPGEFANPSWTPFDYGGGNWKLNSVILYRLSTNQTEKNWIISNTTDTLTLLNNWKTIDPTGPISDYRFNIYTRQLEDSDFYNEAWWPLWDQRSGVGRNDLQTIRNDGYNLIRLYNWNPARSNYNFVNPPTTPDFAEHRSFLDKVASFPHTITINGHTFDDGGLKVVVPVSNYFLGNAEWSNQVPVGKAGGVYYPKSSAPQAIQNDFDRFIASIKDSSGKISPAVHSIEIGNEIDISSFGTPSPADTQVARIFWWVVNLKRVLDDTSLYQPGQAHPLFTIPVSNADQDPNVIKGPTPDAGTDNTINILIPPSGNWNPSKDWARTHLVANNVQMRIQAQSGPFGDLKTISGATDLVFKAGFWRTTLTINGTWGNTTGNPVAGTQYQIFDPDPTSWFQIFAGGTSVQVLNPTTQSITTKLRFIPPNTGNSLLPDGPISQFANAWPGLREALGERGFVQSFYNSYQSYQTDGGLQNLVNQYSHYQPNSNWQLRWPGEQFEVPLLLSEVGDTRLDLSNTDPTKAVLSASTQQTTVADKVVTPLEQIWTQSTKSNQTNLMGYGIFEFNDEPNANDAIPNANKAIAWYGLYSYYQSTADPLTFPVPGDQFREVHVLPGSGYLASGTTMIPTLTGTDLIYAFTYDLYSLFPVSANGVTTANKVKSLFTTGNVNG